MTARSLFCSLLFGVVLAAAPPSARAELILDDFNDPASVNSPEMEDEFANTSPVGELDANRHIRIAASQTDVIGFLDSDLTLPSVLTASVSEHRPISEQAVPKFSYQFNYDFPPTDVSEGGRNNSLIFDFASIGGTESPLFLQFGLWDESHPNTIFLGRIVDVPMSRAPLSIVFPFSDFTTRAGTPAQPDFSAVERIDFSFYFLNATNGVNWTAELDRVYFGVPEPRSSWMALVGFALYGSRWRRTLCNRRVE